MSMWLKNVSTYLERLDDQAETVVEQRLNAALEADENDDEINLEVGGGLAGLGGQGQGEHGQEGLGTEKFGQGKSAVDLILAKRGLVVDETGDDDEEVVDFDADIKEDDKKDQEGKEDEHEKQQDQQREEQKDTDEKQPAVVPRPPPQPKLPDGPQEQQSKRNEKHEEVNKEDDTTKVDKTAGSPDITITTTAAADTAITNKTDVTSSSTSADTAKSDEGTKSTDKPQEKEAVLNVAPKISTDKDGPIKSTEKQSSWQQQKQPIENSNSKTAGKKATTAATGAAQTTQQSSSTEPKPPTTTDNSAIEKNKQLNMQLRESQKETRILRKNILALNKQLEISESEIIAQRKELERASVRIENDLKRYKEEKEKEAKRHADEINTFKQQQEKNNQDMKNHYELQLQEIRKQLSIAEEKRMEDSGNWNNELVNALEREQGLIQKVNLLEDEKSTFLAQISTLQSQQTALGNRLESLTKTADDAMMREKESEDRLDEILSQHARQINQRQMRENELERTIAELGEALVLAQRQNNNNNNNNTDNTNTSTNNNDLGGNSNNSDRTNNNNIIASLKNRIDVLQDDLETCQSNLSLERQRSETLQQELRDISKERKEEVATGYSRQLEFDKQVSEMSHTISRLQSALRDATGERLPADDNNNNNNGDTILHDNNEQSQQQKSDNSTSKQIKTLSEEIVRQREKMTNYSSEISALKNRLKAALDRADRAEAQAEEAVAVAGALSGPSGSGGGGKSYDNFSSDDDLETAGGGAPASGNVRRRGVGVGGRRRRRRDDDGNDKSIRSAIPLGQGKRSEQIGKAIDLLDSLSASLGRHLRHSPLARATFIMYLLLIHLWTFTLLFFHAHNFENIHGDFGAGTHVHHGPHSLMKSSSAAAMSAAVAAAGGEGANKVDVKEAH